MWRDKEVSDDEKESYELNPYDSFMRKHLQHYGYFTGRNQNHRHAFRSYADWEKTHIYIDSESDSDSDDASKSAQDNRTQEELLRTTQLIYNFESGKMVPKLREPRNLYALAKEPGPQQAARWPSELQVENGRINHIRYIPAEPEPVYRFTGFEKTPMVRGEENGGKVVFDYDIKSSFFVRSRVGGSRNGCDDNSYQPTSPDDTTLVFESRFESGNLAKAVKVGENDYELHLRYDLFTSKHTQWFYFRVRNTRPNINYRFTIVNLMKPDSLYNYGMKPLMYSEKTAQQKKIGWIRAGSNIKYYRNNLKYEVPKGDKPFYSLTWTSQFSHAHDDVYFAHCYPYTYTDLQDYLLELGKDPIKSRICKQRVLCRTLAGNLVYLLTITSPSQNPDDLKHKKAVVITSRVHPGESNSSWMMKGFLDYLTGNSADAKLLRDTFIFKIVPMLNPDGVIVGNYRCSLAGRDLNRNYKTMLKDSYPTVWHTRSMIRKLLQEREIVVYCDLHGHSRKQNVFIYGCENKHQSERRLRERIFPCMLGKNAPTKFSFDSCKFKVQKSKEGTGRIVVWNMGVLNSFTLEATFCGSSLGKTKGHHFSVADFESLGYHFCDTLLDYCDPDNTKYANIYVDLEDKIKKEILIRMEKEGVSSPQDIDLSDFSSELESSDGGSDSSVSDGPPVHLQYSNQRSQKKKKKLKSRKERDRQNQRIVKEEIKKVPQTTQSIPASSAVSETPTTIPVKKPLSGHQSSHGKYEQAIPIQTLKYTMTHKPQSTEEKPIVSSILEKEDKTKRNDYLEALTVAYLKNGIPLLNDPVPHFRYSGSDGSTPNLPFNLDGLCPHHEQSFAAHYVAHQLHTYGDQNPEDVRSRKEFPRHLFDISSSQQRQDSYQRNAALNDKAKSLKQHPNPFDEKQEKSADYKRGKQLYPRSQVASSTGTNVDTHHVDGSGENQQTNTHNDQPLVTAEDDDNQSNSRDKNGRKSRMGMHSDDNEEDDDIRTSQHLIVAKSGRSIKSTPITSTTIGKNTPSKIPVVHSSEEINEAVKSIHDLKSSISSLPKPTIVSNNIQRHNLSNRTNYIQKMIKETNDEIEVLKKEIKEDITEKKISKERREISVLQDKMLKTRPLMMDRQHSENKMATSIKYLKNNRSKERIGDMETEQESLSVLKLQRAPSASSNSSQEKKTCNKPSNSHQESREKQRQPESR
ncbi:hypothetical protein SNE40_003379 [Patella caerulea]|uniref:Peptidase M14 domain-containing protein n=1 Tax=Patella caerulea TaxID=87958 RepID=A0AAN8KG99_PATCE